MNISVFGIGYVGVVASACLCEEGHSVIAVDVNLEKVNAIAGGKSPIVEPHVAELLARHSGTGQLRATSDVGEAIRHSEASLICVGTPSAADGSLNLVHVEAVCAAIAEVLTTKKTVHQIILRSTMLPGSTRFLAEKYFSAADVEVFFYPEFLRESTAVMDFREPALTVVGSKTGERAETPAWLDGLAVDWTTWEEAELLKYACNAFHATKVAFANEIGRIGKSAGVDSRRVMALLCQDHVLNISPYYLRPGNPFGGSCLPKDVRALSLYAKAAGLDIPVISHLLASNESHLQMLVREIERSGKTDVALLGLSFKQGTDDLRESPMVSVAHELLERGFEVSIFDSHLDVAKLLGANQTAMEKVLPSLAELMRPSLRQTISESGVVIFAHRYEQLDELSRILTSDNVVIDMVGDERLRTLASRYVGLCW